MLMQVPRKRITNYDDQTAREDVQEGYTFVVRVQRNTGGLKERCL